MSVAPGILVAYPGRRRLAGGNGVAVWIVQALVDAGYPVTLATLIEPDLEMHDQAFGTSLAGHPALAVVVAPSGYRRVLGTWPTAGGEVEVALLARWTARVRRRGGQALVVSAHNEMDLPGPGLQYVHYPRHYTRRPPEDRHWYHRLPLALPAYRAVAARLAGGTRGEWRGRRTLANSAWVAGLCREAGMTDVAVLHPPVPPGTPVLPWDGRANRFLSVGRIHPTKRIPQVVRILDGLRGRGHPVEGVLVGPWDCDADHRRLVEGLLAERPWLHHQQRLTRSELQALMAASRWGLHAMVEEHFGMAVAEMTAAGQVVFAHDSGGPREILESPGQLFSDDADAVRRIDAVLCDEEDARRRHEWARKRGRELGADTFAGTLVAEVRQLVGPA